MTRTVAYVQEWAVWRLPRPALAYVLAVETAAALALTVGVLTASFRIRDAITFAVLVACGAVSIEGSRRLGVPYNRENQPYKDLLSAWTLPIALLLPPVYALLAPVPLYLHTQRRVARVAPMKRTFNTAAVGLAGYVTATTHEFLAGQGPPYDLTTLVGTPGGLLATGAAAVAGAAVNVILVAGVIHRVTPGKPLRQLVADRDRLVIDAAELGIGVVTAVCWLVTPALILALLPPVLLLQRTLVHAELEEAARTDAKTRLANPAYWREVATRGVMRALRGDRRLAVLLIDIDHFKRVNDTYGHLVGDHALAGVAATITDSVRPSDLVGRFGGEEFAVLLPATNLSVAARTAERIRSRVERRALPVAPGSPPLRLTVSVGAAALHAAPEDDLAGLLESADVALYSAKTAGRNTVRLPGPGRAGTGDVGTRDGRIEPVGPARRARHRYPPGQRRSRMKVPFSR